MRVTRVYVGEPLATDTDVALPDAAAYHVARVLRLREGAALIAFDGSGSDFRCEIVAVDGRQGARARRRRARRPARVAARASRWCRPSRAASAWTGRCRRRPSSACATIVPVLSARSVVRLDERQAAKKLRHWQAIVAGACEQCGRSIVPGGARAARPRPLPRESPARDSASC